MPKIKSFTVVSEIPAALQPLREIANNLWWTWNFSAKNLFRMASREAYFGSKKNPTQMLNCLSRGELERLSEDPHFLDHLGSVHRDLNEYLSSAGWWETKRNQLSMSLAYFSAEFGLHESVPIYSGGLGVLAGDFLKAASDLGLPATGVGLFYYEGYFSQYLNADGWQQESYPQVHIIDLPVTPVLTTDGQPLTVSVDIAGQIVFIRSWKLQVGRVPLYLLDTNFELNKPAHRTITSRLYGGDHRMRIEQEIVLGIGGSRLLAALGQTPSIFHMNEGHSAFLAFEQIRSGIQDSGLTFQEALAAAQMQNIFTTHTPVPAGNDSFQPEWIEHYFSGLARSTGISMQDLLGLGRMNPNDTGESFSMTVFALKTSQHANGVSQLHGHVSRNLWHSLWPDLPTSEVPIKAVTNGVHTATWASRDVAEMFERHLGRGWREDSANSMLWEQVHAISDHEIWGIRQRSRADLVTFCRERARDQLVRRGAGRIEVENANSILDPNALTIGFARRFATYKRAALVFRDIERLIRLAANHSQPVQFVFAGKAHPADQPGKEFITSIVHEARRAELYHRFVFLEDYNMGMARNLVQGVDIWLNNPRRPLEASGTSGMKVAVNGGLNFSVLDGWWCEGFDGSNGWAIGQGEEYTDTNYQDDIESRSIYDTLEREIIPLFYRRDHEGIPREWLGLIKQSIASLSPRFSSNRMVQDYTTNLYLPLTTEQAAVNPRSKEAVVGYAREVQNLRQHWSEVQIVDVKTTNGSTLLIGKKLEIVVTTQLGTLTSENVAAQVYYGAVDATENIRESQVELLAPTVAPFDATGQTVEFRGALGGEQVGSFGYSVRLVPKVAGTVRTNIPGLITWWS